METKNIVTFTSMKCYIVCFCLLLSSYTYGKESPFTLRLLFDTIEISRVDTVFTCTNQYFPLKIYAETKYINGSIKTTTIGPRYKTIVNCKIDYIDSTGEMRLAKLVYHGLFIVKDAETGAIIRKANYIAGKKVGVVYDWEVPYNPYQVWDSSGTYLQKVKYQIDNGSRVINKYEVDSSSFKYVLNEQREILVNKEIYFRTWDKYGFGIHDTANFWFLNGFMTLLDLKPWDQNGEFIRFVALYKRPCVLSIVKSRRKTYVSIKEYDQVGGNIIKEGSKYIENTKVLDSVLNKLNRIDFWHQVSTDECGSVTVFIEARCGKRYNSKRLSCYNEIKLPENIIVMEIYNQLYDWLVLELKGI